MQHSALRNLVWPWTVFASAAVFFTVFFMGALWGQARNLDATISSSTGPLDGRTFRASIMRGNAGPETEALIDQLSFNRGKFSSALCKQYNFTEAPYWVRQDNSRIHFLVEITSPTDGTMIWRGTVAGEVLDGTMRWIKQRWYWTIDVEHKIQGKLSQEVSPGAPATR
jgi:hypothetical protein